MNNSIQMTLFDVDIQPAAPYRIGQLVKVIVPKNDSDPESYYYLKQFEKRSGAISKVVKRPKLQYEIDYGKVTAYVYHEEIERKGSSWE